MHLGRIGRFFAATFLAVGLSAAGAGASSAQKAIGPHQHFSGLVNGSNNTPVVYTSCPGPVSLGRTGPVAGGQTFAVAERVKGKGFTGLFSQVYAWFVPSAATAPASVVQVKFTRYGVAKSIPRTVRVPCDGRGTVEFSSCPFQAPCAAGWVPDYVAVKFVNIAV
jgi:hypothetical protein